MFLLVSLFTVDSNISGSLSACVYELRSEILSFVASFPAFSGAGICLRRFKVFLSHSSLVFAPPFAIARQYLSPLEVD